MRKLHQTTKLHRTRILLLVGVLASLCFSVGEGLRLLPLPLPSFSKVDVRQSQAKFIAPLDYSLSKFTSGPLGVPAKAQKRVKRQMIHYGTPPARSIYVPPVQSRERAYLDRPVISNLLLNISELTGRSPPHIV